MPHDSPAAPTRAPRPDDGTFQALHAEREALERDLALAKARQNFSTEPGEAERARADEASMLMSLDRLLTRIRAAEYQRRPGAKRW
ncbi:hypothetical protein FV222_08040 [Methylobacterium sp. WL103]|uniref:hypothetical protein n=1 Tax=unclassified Methylobacterium TaxID=2615210 RepID=UPI0011CC5E31|nr:MULTISPECIES: hypothetical protein [unclassified Methylobacterium]TXM69813.1 hypothetical protein FV226_17955 [Methylobacterium sp. WL12]TXN03880.1 hypothetical protein FV222_08040 [Methylobacterium sp. WL103]